MSCGLQIFDASGNLVLDATYRVMRIIGSQSIGYGISLSGSVSDSRLQQGGFVSFQPNIFAGEGFMSGGVLVPTFSISNGVLSWNYPALNNATYDTYQGGIFFYGAY